MSHGSNRQDLLGPFKYVEKLLEPYREQAAKNDAWCLEQIEFALSQTLSHVSKEEFMERVGLLWDECWDRYMDYLSTPHD